MSGIGAIGANNYNASAHYYRSLSSGKKVNTAADNAAALSILQKQLSQSNGLDVGTENLQAGKSALNIAEGALGNVTDSLQRIRELAVKAANGTNSDDDRADIQKEIDQLKQGISDIAGRTKYNERDLLNGTEDEISLASDGNGSKKALTLPNGTLESLGIADFDVTKDFDISDIDAALDKISDGRSTLGAQSNTYDHATSYNSLASYNTVAAQSRIGDTEYGQYVSELQKQQTLNNYQIMMQRQRQEQAQNRIAGLGI